MADNNVMQPQDESRTHQIRTYVEEAWFEHAIELRGKGYYKGKYKGLFWAYILWLGLNQYEKEVLPKEM